MKGNDRRLIRNSASALAMSVASICGMVAGDAVFVGQAAAQEASGDIRGQIADAETGLALQGARVSIVELDRRAVADRSGAFVLEDVPVGTYTLLVDYLGLPQQSQQVNVTPGSTAQLSIRLSGSSAGAQEEIVVVGRVNEVTRRINEERNADALTEVASSSSASEFPDRNVGEVLQRLTGTFIDRSGTGEGNILLVRGINAVNNLVLVEGMRMPSGRGDGRTPNLATINADVIDSIEVRKVFTPEIPGDFFGGYVNARQSSPFDRRGSFLTMGIETGERSISNHGADIELSLRGSNRFMDDSVGLSFALGYDERDATFHQYNATRSPNAGGVPALIPTLLQYREVDGEITRYSANFGAEYAPDTNARYFARLFYNYGVEETRDSRINVNFAPPLNPTSTSVTGAFGGVTPELEAITASRPEEFVNLVLGGENSFNGWTLDYSIGANSLQSEQADAVRYAARSPAAIAGTAQYNFTDQTNPQLSLANPALLSTVGSYGLVVSPSTNIAAIEEDQLIAQLNASREVAFAGGRLEGRLGARFDRRDRSADVGGVQAYANIPGASAYIVPGPSGLFNGQFNLPLVLSFGALNAVFTPPDPNRPPGDPNFRASIAGDFSGTEDISSLYAMGTYRRGGLQIIGGVRYESTETSGENFAINNTLYNPADPNPLDPDPSDGVAPRSLSAEYERVLPAVVMRWEPTEDLLVRASLTQTYARPTIAQLFTGETATVVGLNRNITRGNPDLQPQDATNFDASIDYYAGDTSVARLGVFYKDITDVFYTASSTEANSGGGTDFISQPQNGGNAEVYGVELGLIQNFGFIAAPLEGLSVEFNLGLSWSSQEVLNAAGAVIRETDLEGAYDVIGNLSLVYRRDGFRGRLAYRESGERLNTIDVNPSGGFNDAFRDSSSGLDADISFDIGRGSFFIEGRNLLDDVEVVEYVGGDSRNVTRLQYSGQAWGAGVRVRF